MARRQSKARAATSRAAESVGGIVKNPGQVAESVRDAISQTGEQVREGMQQGIASGSRQFAVLGEQAFDAWMRTGSETMQRVLALNAELANWSREQLDDSIGAVRSLAECHSIVDAYSVQLGLMRASMENSLRHANRLFGLATHLMSDAARVAQARP